MPLPRLISHHLLNTLRILCLLVLITACSGNPTPVVNTSPQSATPDTSTLAEIIFEVKTPSKLAEGQALNLELLDEVTGLALNASRVKLESKDQQNFSVKMQFPLGSVLKYRYVRENDPAGIEYTSQGRQVRYRLFMVEGAGTVKDLINAWKSEPTNAVLGRIQGQVANKTNNAPVVNALVAAGGVHSLTSSDGSFILEGLPPGTHSLVVYSLDGSFKTFQQGALVAAESTTPALIMLSPNKMVKVSFIVQPPKDHSKGAPLRMVGNIYTLGNTFADLSGGVSVLASRAPLMASQPDGRYILTLDLPAGLDLRYKYTLGDGFWNSELGSSGEIITRQLIVPDRNTAIQDNIQTWQTPGSAPISFSVTVPASNSDTVSIQFNPYGWTQPIPMWPAGPNQWSYVLYNPLNLFASASYRYCRNEQCGTADAQETSGPAAQGKAFQPQASAQTFQDTVTSWSWSEEPSDAIVVPADPINKREGDFLASVELMPGYHPSWQPYIPTALQTIRDIGANSVILTPTWQMTNQTPPVMAPVPGLDPLWFDITQMAIQSQQKQLALVLHPSLRYPSDPVDWWKGATRDAGWWQSWFDRYESFLIYHADLATQTGAKALVIGDGGLLAALPDGTLADGSPSGVPDNAETRWGRLISNVRSRYTGKLVWLVPFAGKMPLTPSFLDQVDEVYVEIQPPLVGSDDASPAELENFLSALLDADIQALQEEIKKPVTIGLKYPSARGALDGCIETNGECLPFSTFEQPGLDLQGVEISAKEQADVYGTLLSALNKRPWIAGFYAGAFFAPAELKDASVSIRGKRAADVLWYWYPRLLGQVSP